MSYFSDFYFFLPYKLFNSSVIGSLRFCASRVVKARLFITGGDREAYSSNDCVKGSGGQDSIKVP